MKHSKQTPQNELVFEYSLDAPPEKVWRAISLQEYRAEWLPNCDLDETQPMAETPGEEIIFRMREDGPPSASSTVTFQIRSDVRGGTRLRIIHKAPEARAGRKPPVAANCNGGCLLRAA
ncbi:polyketide cyclase [Hoeflea sp. WL0058]|uniref:Polyketide cyclase n=1 Tax=Flavimaribacter sediminis TaxID=2865987 RepID=A0AAE3D0H6_9HYPH|nr:polyketide cyclase [Flavimaribacter sediminis]MBW8636756.1 polyketide cyclase [Flavimaribacter sediminis]